MDYTVGIIRNTEFFTTSELAKKLKMNVQVITRKVQSGDIQAYKIGKDWRIPEPSVHAWLEQRSNDSAGSTKVSREIEQSTPKGKESQPSPRTKRKYLLQYVLAQFEPGRSYSEAEVDTTIGRYAEDVATVRGEFLSEEMMEQADGIYQRRPDYRLSG